MDDEERTVLEPDLGDALAAQARRLHITALLAAFMATVVVYLLPL